MVMAGGGVCAPGAGGTMTGGGATWAISGVVTSDPTAMVARQRAKKGRFTEKSDAVMSV